MAPPETRILVGDARSRLRDLADESVHCVVTSPPYWGLRSYHGSEGMVGLEGTLDEHIGALVEIFREVRRVLRNDGTCWLNYGDAYASSPPGNKATGLERWKTSGLHDAKISERYAHTLDQSQGQRRDTVKGSGFKPKDLLLMPARVAIALQDDGWWVRSEIVWIKKNPMPESVRDRPTNAHEKVFLLTKRPTYYYDADSVRTSYKPGTLGRYSYGFEKSHTAWGGLPSYHEQDPREERRSDSRDASTPSVDKGANLRNCWTIPTAPFADAHFATFPPALATIPIKAGTSERGCCSACGTPWRRVTERIETGWDGSKYAERVVAANVDNGGTDRSTLGSSGGTETADYVTLGWNPSCECESQRVPCTILDPFAGAGTAGMVAARLGRSSVLVEISPEYADMAAERLRLDAGLLALVSVE